MPDIQTIAKIRLAVAFLGERPQHAWWDTAFLNPLGSRYLGLVFPKTTSAAALTAASEAACRVHDERVGRGQVLHLFRLSSEMEARVRVQAASQAEQEILSLCSRDSALRLLDSAGAQAEPPAAAGPVRIGALKESGKPAALAGLAATYASGFRTGTPVFPYFA